jgi:polyisoprenoid-binding protein YceI
VKTQATETLAHPRIETTRWRIDPTRSSVEFHVKGFWGLTTVRGHFAHYHGTLDLAAEPAIELVIEANSLDTKNARRDEHLRSSDFFDADRFPYIRFVSEGVTLTGERLEVHGRLHAAGQSMPLDFEATLRPAGDELELEANTEADHHELGMTWNKLGAVRTPSRLMVNGRLIREADAALREAAEGETR